jgi:hypothetical protein
MTVIAKLRELKTLTPKALKMIKIPSVINEYSKKIFKTCLKVSALLKDMKLVKDFLKL